MDVSQPAVPLLDAKIQRPRYRLLVPNHRLRAALAASVASARVTLLWAGPGYGKTHAMLDFLEHQPHPFTWYQVGPEDSDPAVLLYHLAEAFIRTFPDGLRHLRGMFDANSDPLRAVTVLCSALGGLGVERALLVLDDVHAATGEALEQCLGHLFRLLPPAVHCLVSSRTRPVLPLGNMLASGQAAWLPPELFRLTPAEAAALLAASWGGEPAPEVVERALALTHGWVTGLALLAAASGPCDRPGNEDLESVYAYLAGEVLRQQRPALRAFLQRTAVLDDFSSQLLLELLPDQPVASLLDEVRDRDLFVVRLEGDWYRYHDLFRDFLRAQVPERETNRLLTAAARLLERGREWFRALEYWARAGRTAEAVRLLTEHGEELVLAGQTATLRHWAERLSAGHPLPGRLQLHLGRACEVQGEYDLAEHHYELARSDPDPVVRARSLLGGAAVMVGRGRASAALPIAHQALDLLPADDHAERGRAYALMARAVWTSSQWQETVHYGQLAIREYRRAGDLNGESVLLNNLAAAVYEPQGEFAQARDAFWRAYETDIKRGALAHASISLANAGLSDTRLGEFERGRQLISEALALGRASTLHALINALGAWGQWQRDTGDLPGAIATLEEAVHLQKPLGDPWRLAGLYFDLSICHRLAGNLPRAHQYAEDDFELVQGLGNNYFLCQTHVNLGFVAQAAGQGEQAGEWARRALAVAITSGFRHEEMQARLLLAVATGDGDQFAAALGMAAALGYWPVLLREWKLVLPLLYYHGSGPYAALAATVTSEVARRELRPGRDELPECWRLLHDQPVPRVWCLGSFAFTDSAGRPVEFRLQKSALLLQMLVLRKGRWCSRRQVMEVLWPGLPPDRAQSNLRVTLHSLRQSLRTAGHEDWLEVTDRSLRLSPAAHYWCDVEEVQALHRGLRARGASSLVHWGRAQRIVELCQRGGEPDPALDNWAHSPYPRLRDLHLNALRLLCRRALRRGDYDGAEQHARDCLGLDPYDEQACSWLIRSYLGRGMRHRAVACYEEFARRVREDLGVDPWERLARLLESGAPG